MYIYCIVLEVMNFKHLKNVLGLILFSLFTTLLSDETLTIICTNMLMTLKFLGTYRTTTINFQIIDDNNA